MCFFCKGKGVNSKKQTTNIKIKFQIIKIIQTKSGFFPFQEIKAIFTKN